MYALTRMKERQWEANTPRPSEQREAFELHVTAWLYLRAE